MREVLILAGNLESLKMFVFQLSQFEVAHFFNRLLVTEFLCQNKEEYVSAMGLIGNTEEEYM